ncbi:MAG: hypothetical protein ACI31F_01465 [Muribaculaceae bacterium]
MATKETKTVEASEQRQSSKTGSAVNWKEVTIGGVSGILLGSAGTFAASAATPASLEEQEVEAEDVADEAAAEEQEYANLQVHGNVASGVNDSMSFGEAFAAARAEVGAGGCFVWHGNVYGTYYANEWNAMSEDQHGQFANNTVSVHNSGTGSSVNNEETIDVSDDDDTSVEILGVDQIQQEDGSVVNVGVASVEGQAVYFLDLDGQDDQFEYLATDANGNGTLDDDEFQDISEHHVSVSQFQELAQADPLEGYYAQNENLPDYVNNADPADLT